MGVGVRIAMGMAIAVGIAACGIVIPDVVPNTDGGGAESGSDVINGDSTTDASVPPICATLDASCVPSVPEGWTLFGISPGTKACPSSDFDPFPLVTNPRLKPSSCTCSACNVSSGYTCGGFTIKTGSLCVGTTDTKPASPVCVARTQQQGISARISGTPAAATGTPTCSITSTGTQAVDTDAVTGCRPNKCTANYCGLKATGFQTCIERDNALGCPAGFSPFGTTGQVGTSGTATCDVCTCAVGAPQPCTGNIRVFSGDPSCDGNGSISGVDYKITVPANGTCQNPLTGFDSLYYVPDPAAPATCTPAGATGQAGLTGVKTICCAP